MLFGLGRVFLASLLASGAFGLPTAQNGNTETKDTESPDKKASESQPLPPVAEAGPGYSILLAKETSPSNVHGSIVTWGFGDSYCLERHKLSDDIQYFCNTNLTLDRVPKIDEKLQPTGQVTQITGYFDGCSDEVSLEKSYAGLYWVELIGMNDGIGDQPASEGGSTTQSTDDKTKSTDDKTKSTSEKTKRETQSETGTSDPAAYKCNSDQETHGCTYLGSINIDLTTFASCGNYAYTSKPGTSSAPDANSQSTSDQKGGSGGGGSTGGVKKYKTLKAIKA